MKGMLKKLAVIAAVCFVVLCVSGYSEPTPEQIKERTELLVKAVNDNNVEQARVCIKLGADVNAETKYGGSALKLAIEWGRIDIAELLIKSGANMNDALVFVVKEGDKDMVNLLISAGADVNAKDLWTRPVLLVAINERHKDIAELLIKSGADVNAKDQGGFTPLMEMFVDKDIAELLIKSGADVNAKDNYGHTVLYNANATVAELLIKAGVDGEEELIRAIKEPGFNFDSKVTALINAGVNPNAKDSEGISVLTYAILYGKKDIADLLRAAGAKE